MVENQQSDDYSTISRRRFAQIAGATGAAALAGCGGGDTTTEGSGDEDTPMDGGETDDSTPDSSTQVFDAEYNNLNQTAATADLQYNHLNSSSYAGWIAWTLTDRLIAYNFSEREYYPYALEDYTIEPQRAELNIRSDYAWADGTDYTSIHLKQEIAASYIVGGGVWDYIDTLDNIKTPDDKTLVLELPEPANPTALEHEIGAIQTNIRAKEGTPFATLWKEMQENGVDGVSDSTNQEVSNFSPSSPPMTAAPWTFDSGDANGVRLSRNDEHPDVDNINFSNYYWGASPSNQHKQSQLVSGKVNSVMSLYAPPRIAANVPDKFEEARPPAYWGYGLMPNHERPHVEHREVRQAIQHAIDRSVVKQNAGPRTKEMAATPGALCPGQPEEEWLGDTMDSYLRFEDVERGKELLEEAGYTQDGGTWKDSNGKAASLEVSVFAGWSDWVTASQTIVSQLNDFGFDASLNTVPGGSAWGDILPNSKFQIHTYSWMSGGPRGAFPYYSARRQVGYVWSAGNIHNYPGWNDGDGQEITVPDGNGGELSANPVELVDSIPRLTDEEELTQTVRDLHRVLNADQAFMPLSTKLEQSWYEQSDAWAAPDEDSTAAGVKWPSCWLPKQGDISYKGD
ncbi:ABC transporter substrate-binding protein [Halorhabdus salina]|uniref:ABC transporter substrate-binding protein n=1 Tax=Halorhabdus salina TaxID=2750670 RepID=UPI0015EE9F89|nr:ABC transporter substrate-binding protein [Halorhabdus salina]